MKKRNYKNVANIRYLVAELESMKETVHDADCKKQINELYELLRYSDPVSTPLLEELETRIQSNVALLKEAVEDEEPEKTMVRAEQLRKLIIERDHKVKALKR